MTPAEPAPPPPPPPTAGEDPLFVGADGKSYEVKGDAGAAFNLLSSRRLSINAEFVGVPPRYRALDITETVLGATSIALCAGVNRRTFAILVSAFA